MEARDRLRVADPPDGRRGPQAAGALSARGAARWQHLPALPATDPRGNTFFVYPHDGVIGRALLSGEGHETAIRDAALAELAGHPVEEVIDIGANIGTVVIDLLARFPGARGLAFEPAPGNLALLALNLRVNRQSDRVAVRPFALGDRDGAAELELCEDNLGDHRLRTTAAPGALGEHRRATCNVQVRSFDALGREPSPAGLVSIDVQGHEGHVLAGGALLRRLPTVAEYWPYALERSGGLELFLDAAREYGGLVRLPDRARLDVDALRAFAGGTTDPLAHLDVLLLP